MNVIPLENRFHRRDNVIVPRNTRDYKKERVTKSIYNLLMVFFPISRRLMNIGQQEIILPRRRMNVK